MSRAIPPASAATPATSHVIGDARKAVFKASCDVVSASVATGEGMMFVEKTEDEEISEMLADIQLSGSSSFKHRLAVALARLDDDGWKWLEEFVNSIANQSDNQV